MKLALNPPTVDSRLSVLKCLKSAYMGECMCLFIIVDDFLGAFWNACVAHVDFTTSLRGMCVGAPYGCRSYDCAILPSWVLPSHHDLKGQRCGTALRPLQESSVPWSALTLSQPLSDETGSKGSLSISVSIVHIDLNDSYTLTTAAPPAELTSAFTSTRTVSLHTQTCAKKRSTPLKPALDSQKLTLSM